jgi:hypothetical protein
MFINSVAWQDIEEVYAMEIQVCDDPVNRIHVTAADIIPGRLFSVNFLMWQSSLFYHY